MKESELKSIFHQEINKKKWSKYVTAFDYIDKILIVLSAAAGGASIISFTSIVGAPVGIASASFALIFPLTTGIVNKITKQTKKQKEKAW